MGPEFKGVRGTIFLTWLLSYTLILIIPMLISVFIFLEARGIVESEANHINTLLLNQISLMIDDKLENIQGLGRQIAANPRLLELCYEPDNRGDSSLLYAVMKDFEILEQANLYIDSFYVYLKSRTRVITAFGYLEEDIFYNRFHRAPALPFSVWQELLQTAVIPRFLPFLSLSNSGAPVHSIGFLAPVPAANSGASRATLLILLDKRRIMDFVNLTLQPGSSYFILDGRGRLVLQAGEPHQLPDFGTNRLEDPSGGFRYAAAGGDFYVSFLTSRFKDWKYAALVPVDIYYNRVENFQHLVVLGLALALICGLPLIFLITRKHYQPLRGLLELISRDISSYNESRLNEFKLLADTISQTMAMKKQLGMRITRQNATLNRNWLEEVLCGERSAGPGELRQRLQALGLAGTTPSFLLLLATGDKQLEAGNERPFPYRWPQQLGEVIIIPGSRFYTCLIALTSRGEPAACRLEEIRTGLSADWGRPVTLAASSIAGSAKGLPGLYREARQALAYKLVLGTGRVIRYREIAEPRAIFRYSPATEQALINCIKTGHTAGALGILEKVYTANFGSELISIDMARCLVFNLVSTMIKTMQDARFDSAAAFWNRLQPVERLLACETAEAIREEMTCILKVVCRAIEGGKKSHNTLLKEKILVYIEANLTDINLYAASIARAMGLNQSYFCRFFKEQLGQSINTYINTRRIDRARQRLREGNETIAELARKLGFSSDRAFIRTFKKIEGITPGKFRGMPDG